MSTRQANSNVVKFLFVLSALFTFMVPGIVMAGNSLLTVQTEGNASNASAGESGAAISSSALISVVVTNTLGAPVSNLGSFTGDGTSEIELPDGWTLSSGFNVPPGGCLMTPTQFYNGSSPLSISGNTNNSNHLYSVLPINM